MHTFSLYIAFWVCKVFPNNDVMDSMVASLRGVENQFFGIGVVGSHPNLT